MMCTLMKARVRSLLVPSREESKRFKYLKEPLICLTSLDLSEKPTKKLEMYQIAETPIA